MGDEIDDARSILVSTITKPIAPRSFDGIPLI